MSVKDTLASFIDNTGLSEVFHRKEADPVRVRKPLIDGIEKAKTQFEAGNTKGARWWKASNGVVALTVKVGGNVFDINGVQTNHMPQERFVEFLGKFRKAVESGEFDAELATHGEGDAKVHIAKAPRKPREAGSGGGSREWTPERREKFAASIAARKAAKA